MSSMSVPPVPPAGSESSRRPPLAGPLADPCVERDEVGDRLRGLSADGPAYDVFLSGTVFMDMIFSGMEAPPRPGTEVFTHGLGSAPGGAANMAVAMSRLGLKVALASAFGDDMFGGYLWRTLAEQEKVDLTASRQLANWPTPVTVSMSYAEDRSMLTYGAPLPFPESELVAVPLPAATCFVDLGEGLPGWATALRRSGTTVYADLGWDPTGEWSPAVLRGLSAVDVFLPNAAEAMAYTRCDSPAAALRDLADRVAVCAVKVGSAGAIAIDNLTGEEASAPAIPVEALDPTGAGDVFAAGFVFGSLAGWSLAHRLRFANLCAGLSVRRYSGSLGAPCWAEIAAWGESQDVPAEVLAEYGFLVSYLPEDAVDDMVRATPTVGSAAAKAHQEGQRS